MYLLVCFWQTMIFQHQSLRRPTSHCLKEPRRTIRHESKVSYLMYFDILSCYDVPMPNCSSFISALLCFKSFQTKTIVDFFLLCENKTSGYLLYMCVWEFGSITTRKVFMEEISLFMSIYRALSRTRTLYYGKRGVTWFYWYQSHYFNSAPYKDNWVHI